MISIWTYSAVGALTAIAFIIKMWRWAMIGKAQAKSHKWLLIFPIALAAGIAWPLTLIMAILKEARP